MSSYLLDSDVLMDFFKKKQHSIDFISSLVDEGELATSILSVAELRSGWNPQQAKDLLPRLYDTVEIKTITKETAELAGKFRFEYRLQGISLPTVDTLIAATAIVGNCYLVTNNKKDYPMKEIRFYSLQKDN